MLPVVYSSEVRTEEFFKAAKINSLISMALLYSKHGTCYFIELILTFMIIINCRIFVKQYQHTCIHLQKQLQES